MIDFVVQLCTIGLDDGWVILHKLHEIVDYVGEEDGEEDCGSDEGLLGGDGVVLWDGDEGEDIDLLEHAEADVGLLLSDEGLLHRVLLLFTTTHLLGMNY